MIFAVTGITALRAIFTGRAHFPWTASVLLAACIWIAAQLCAGQTVYRFGTFQSLLLFLSIAGAFWSTLQLLGSDRALRATRKLLIAIGSATAAFSIVYLLTSNGRVYWVIDTLDSWRPMGPFLNANHNAVFMELLLPLAVWEALHGARKKYVYGAAAALMYSSVIFSASRAGIILATLEIAALVLHSLVHARFSRRTILTGCVLLACVAGGAFLSDWRTVLRRFQTNDMFQQRRELLESTALMIREHPMTGSGLGTWAIVYPRFAVFEPGLAVYHAHNEWAEWTAEGGIPFLVLLGGSSASQRTPDSQIPLGGGRRRRGRTRLGGFPISRLRGSAVLFPDCGPHGSRLQKSETRVQVLGNGHPRGHTESARACIDCATSCRARSKRIVLRMMLSKSVVGLQPVSASMRQMQGTRRRMSSKPPSG